MRWPLGACLLSISALGVAACGSCGDKKRAPSGEVRAVDGGAELTLGSVTLALAPEDLGAVGKPVTADPRGVRFALDVGGGEARIVYLLGGGAFEGERVKAPVEWTRVDDVDAALGALFERAGPRCDAGLACAPSPGRARLVEAVKAEKKERGLVTLLANGAHVFAPEWDATYSALAPAQVAEVKSALAATLEPGAPRRALTRAVTVLPIADSPYAGKLAARFAEVTGLSAPDTLPLREARAAAVMLRVMARSTPRVAAPLACRVLGRKPLDPPKVSGGEVDLAPRAALVAAALLALAKAGDKCEHVAPLLSDPCAPSLRCAKGKPLTGHETSDLMEPLCTKAELAAPVDAELARSARDVVTETTSPPPDAWAFAALAAADAVPADVSLAHERRRYALTQPKTPECDLALAPGTACHCDVATVRDQACRHGGELVHVAFCKFRVDEKSQRITGVVAAAPP